MSTQDTFISHLIELRDRLLRAIVAVLVLFVILFFWPAPERSTTSLRNR
jgi:sec-independent protein translocase protein TatC